MDADGFIVLLDIPRTPEDFDKIMENNEGLPADIVLLVNEKMMWDWKEPNLDLLSQPSKAIDELKKQIESPTRVATTEKGRDRPLDP